MRCLNQKHLIVQNSMSLTSRDFHISLFILTLHIQSKLIFTVCRLVNKHSGASHIQHWWHSVYTCILVRDARVDSSALTLHSCFAPNQYMILQHANKNQAYQVHPQLELFKDFLRLPLQAWILPFVSPLSPCNQWKNMEYEKNR